MRCARRVGVGGTLPIGRFAVELSAPGPITLGKRGKAMVWCLAKALCVGGAL